MAEWSRQDRTRSAFRLGRDLAGAGLTVEQVIDATDAAAASFGRRRSGLEVPYPTSSRCGFWRGSCCLAGGSPSVRRPLGETVTLSRTASHSQAADGPGPANHLAGRQAGRVKQPVGRDAGDDGTLTRSRRSRRPDVRAPSTLGSVVKTFVQLGRRTDDPPGVAPLRSRPLRRRLRHVDGRGVGGTAVADERRVPAVTRPATITLTPEGRRRMATTSAMPTIVVARSAEIPMSSPCAPGRGLRLGRDVRAQSTILMLVLFHHRPRFLPMS
jgi:hypothetical protein